MSMKNEYTTQTVMSEGQFDSVKSGYVNKCDTANASGPASTSIEVYRNNTTAVEVIVKEVPSNKSSKRLRPNVSCLEACSKSRKLEEDIENLKIDLNKANYKLINTRRGYSSLVCELKKHLDYIKQKEIEEQTKNINLRLENDKLKALLESKSKMLSKIKTEMLNMKRLLKIVLKDLKGTSHFNYFSEIEYDDFEKDLKKDCKDNFLDTDQTPAKENGNVEYDKLFKAVAGATFDSCLTKDLMTSFEKAKNRQVAAGKEKVAMKKKTFKLFSMVPRGRTVYFA